MKYQLTQEESYPQLPNLTENNGESIVQLPIKPVDEEELLEDEDPDVELPDVRAESPDRPPGALGGIFRF